MLLKSLLKSRLKTPSKPRFSINPISIDSRAYSSIYLCTIFFIQKTIVMKNTKPFMGHLNFQTYGLYFAIILSVLLIGPNSQSFAQELRTFGAVQILGEINGGFPGAGIGFEVPFGKQFSMVADIGAGTQSLGSTIAFKPAIHYYLKKDQEGFFFGPSFKYITLDEKGENDIYTDNLFSLGFTFGAKTQLKSGPLLFMQLNPHKTFGGLNEADVAGISAQLGMSFKL